jgi:hypothetical protein
MKQFNDQTTVDILEDLESQLIGFGSRAAQNGDTDLFQLIYKFNQKIRQRQYDVKAFMEEVAE